MNNKTKLIIGLGNPDEEYRDTRHNIGFMMLDYINKKNGGMDFDYDKKINGLISKIKTDKKQAILVKPLSYVNKTGDVTLKAKNYFKLKPDNIILIHDDLDIQFGNTKLSFEKNSGGHRGVNSVIKSLKTKKFWRLRIGTANSALKKAHKLPEKKKSQAIVDFVLGKFTKKEIAELNKIFKEGQEKIFINC